MMPTGVVLLLGHPEHLELVLVPAADDVHAEASLANVVPRGHLLGRHEGMMQGNVDRAEHVEAPRRGQQATRPGNRFEAGPVGVGLASVALPPRDGHHALDPDLIRHLRQLEVVLPARLPALGERGIRSPARAIGAEEPEPEAIAVHENGIALSHPSSPSPPLHITHAAGGRIAPSHDVYEAGASTASDSIKPARLAPFRRFALLDPTRSAMFKTHEQKGGRQDMASVALRSNRSFSYPTASESSALAFALRVGEADPTGALKPRLLDRVRVAIRARHYSRGTEKAYVAWIRRYIFFHDKRHPADMGAPEVTRFLSSSRLMAFLLYGAGLRRLECCRLRVQDVDFGTNQIVVRSGKGDNDRVTMLPAVVKPHLARHLERVREQYRCDLEARAAGWNCRRHSPASTRTRAGSGCGSGSSQRRANVCRPAHGRASPPSPARVGLAARSEAGRVAHRD